MSTWRQSASTRAVKTARKLLANTPIQQLPITTSIYRKVFAFGTGGEEVTVAFRSIKLSTSTQDITIVPGLVGGFYEKIELDVFERLASLSGTIVDVGANIGLYSCLAAVRAPGKAEIIAFEPVADNLEYLRRNIGQNDQDSRVTVEAQAVGEFTGELEIFLAAGSIGTHSPSSKNVPGSQASVSVPVVTLDAYTAENLNGPIDLLKIDVEGYEGSVLRGATEMLERDKPTLFVEFVPFHLRNCNFPPADFVDIIFSTYDYVFVTDEPRATLRRCAEKDLLNEKYAHKNANLIAVSAATHAEHLSAIEAYRQNMNGKSSRA